MKTVNATLEKFGYPQRLILETDHWALLLRPAQVTIGSLVLISKSGATAFPDLSPEAFADLRQVCHSLESALKGAFACDKINYLMLMMMDPHVHFHVLPRYREPVTLGGLAFEDRAWPGPPDLGQTLPVGDDMAAEILTAIQRHLP